MHSFFFKYKKTLKEQIVLNGDKFEVMGSFTFPDHSDFKDNDEITLR